MRKRIFILTILAFSVNGVSGQLKTVGPIDFYCNSQLFSIDYGVWSDPIQKCNNHKYDFYTNTVNFNDIPEKDSLVIENIKQSIKNRGGRKFYEQLTLKNIIISHRSDKCNHRKYTLRFILPIDTVFYHRFSMTFDDEGNLISNQAIPDYSSNTNILNFIDYCTAIDIALQDKIFKTAYNNSLHIKRSKKNKLTGEYERVENISAIELSYNEASNAWTWQLYTETVFDGEIGDKHCVSGTWLGKKITIDAHDSTVVSVEDYKEFKTVTYGW